MSRPIVQSYAAAVCFGSVGCLAIALGIFLHSTLMFFTPLLTMAPISAASLEPPLRYLPADGATPPTWASAPPPSEAERARRFEAAVQEEVAAARRSMLRWGIVGAIAGLLFLAHWRILRKEPGR